jgi:hypothetical protein
MVQQLFHHPVSNTLVDYPLGRAIALLHYVAPND